MKNKIFAFIAVMIGVFWFWYAVMWWLENRAVY